MNATPNIIGITGLAIDTSNVLDSAPSVVIFGVAGGGKTFQMASAFQNSLYVQTSPGILRAFADYVAKHPELKWKVPQRITFDESYVMTHGGSWTMCLLEIIKLYLGACDAGKNPYEGLIFDEWSTICERIFAELKLDPWNIFKGRGGKLNIFAVFDYFKGIHRSALAIGRRSRKMVGFVSHAQMPKLVDDDGIAVKGTRGTIKWRGGPKMPMGLSDQSAELCSDADVVLQLEIKEPEKAALSLAGLDLGEPDSPAVPAVLPAMPAGGVDLLDMLGKTPQPTTVAAPAAAAPALDLGSTAPTLAGQRVLYTALDDKWFRKIRGGMGLIRDEEPIDIGKGQGLREILTRAGYSI